MKSTKKIVTKKVKVQTQSIQVEVKKEYKKFFIEKIKEGFLPKFKLAKTVRTLRSNKDYFIFLDSTEQLYETDLISTGEKISELKSICFVEAAKTKKKQIEKEDNVFMISIPRELYKDFRAKYSIPLGIKNSKVGDHYAKCYFDASMLVSRAQLVKRIALVYDGINTIRNKLNEKEIARWKAGLINHMKEQAPDLMVNQADYQEKTGREIISQGLSTVYPRIEKTPFSLLEKVLVFFNKNKLDKDHYINGILINDLDKTYIIKTKEPNLFDKPLPINYEYEFSMAERYGDQFYLGGGVDEMERVMEKMINAKNDTIKELKEEIEKSKQD